MRTAQAELLRLMLDRLGIKQRDIAESTQRDKTHLSFFMASKKNALAAFRKISHLKLNGVSVRMKSLKDEDWKTRWKKYVKPFSITGQIRVVPLWKAGQKANKNDRDIYIDTTLAFGTGLHATTRMMARFIALRRGKIPTFLDVGTGTGILSIIAHRCGARQLYAVDIAQEAIKTAERNFKTNQCPAAYIKAISFHKFGLKKQFDFVAANLLTEDLIRLKDKLIGCARPGKYLAVSGIYRDNYAGFRKRFSDPRLKCLRVLTQKGWYALLFRRK